MKSVMLSIQPKWCELIASGKKTIEVRKTRPKIETPFKCYIYCTQNEFLARKSNGELWFANRNSLIMPNDSVQLSGKVIGEFVCDKVELIACHKYHNGVGFDYTYYTESKDTLTNEAQLTDYDMQQYLGCAEDGECVGYAWHISDLQIYDTPKELREFRKPCKWEEHGEEPDCFICNKSGYTPDMYIDCFNFLTRPPQSWMFCEVSEC